MKYLITGAAGFIGSNATLHILRKGHTVVAIDNMSSGYADLFREVTRAGATCHALDYASQETADLIKTMHPDIVLHFAAIPRVTYSIEQPLETNMNNVQGTLSLLNACRGNIGRFIFSSSSSVNGDVDVFPTPTTLKRRPKSPYALQKAVIEDYCRLWSELYNVDTVSLRYFNVFGPRQYGDSPYSTVISAWCHNITANRLLRIDGTGEQSRDFCYVDNVVYANMLAAESSHTFAGDVFNIAGGETLSINDVCAKFRERFSTDIMWIRGAPRQGDVFKTHADMLETKKILGYQPFVGFDDGLERTFDWWNL